MMTTVHLRSSRQPSLPGSGPQDSNSTGASRQRWSAASEKEEAGAEDGDGVVPPMR